MRIFNFNTEMGTMNRNMRERKEIERKVKKERDEEVREKGIKCIKIYKGNNIFLLFQESNKGKSLNNFLMGDKI